jgi:hypothetical protein
MLQYLAYENTAVDGATGLDSGVGNPTVVFHRAFDLDYEDIGTGMTSVRTGSPLRTANPAR